MSTTPWTGYRVFFWVSTAFAALSTAGWQIAEQAIPDRRQYDPHGLSELRGDPYPFTVEVFGYKYRGTTGDYVDDHILAYGAYEKDILFFMEDYVRARANPDAVFLDVGASEGQHSLFMSRLVKQVHAFEPYPPAAERFKSQVALNDFTNIRLHEVGLGAREGIVPFFAPEDSNIGTGTFLAEHKQGADKVVGSFRVVAGDDWLAPLQLASLDVVKIDVEGFEKPVLQGLAKSLERFRPLLVIEVTHPPRGTINSPAELKGLLPEGYLCLRFREDRNCVISGNYHLENSDRFDRGSRYEMVVAYPKEHDSLIPRERPARKALSR